MYFMVISLLIAVAAHASFLNLGPLVGNMEWEELYYVQKMKAKPGKPPYLPKVRFGPDSTFFFKTPDFISEGKYSRQGSHYMFRPLMAYEIENSDVNKLAPEMRPEAGQKFREAYARSMDNFEGDYVEQTSAFHVSYRQDGLLKSFELHMYTEGDDALPWLVSPKERGYVGLWHMPDPFPEKLDARSRYKFFGLEGLQKFLTEAVASDGCQFAIIDLRSDRSFRASATIGTWQVNGNILTMKDDQTTIEYTISSDGTKLYNGGQVIYVRN